MRTKIYLLLGLLVLAAAWWGPLPELARQAFSAHMAMHMAVVAVAAPLLALALSRSRLDPVRWRPGWFAAVPLSIGELLVVWTWHAPGLHEAARLHPGLLVVEQAMFLSAGLLVWTAALGGDPWRHRDRAGAGVVALLLTSMHMTLLGALLALSPRPLFEHVEACQVLSPLEDQHLGGAIMLVVGGVSYLAGGLALTVPLLRTQAHAKEVRA